MTIRAATPGDIPAMAAIRAVEWQTPRFWEERIGGYLAGTYHPQQALAERAVFVAEAAGPEGRGAEVVGFVAGHRTRRFECDGELQWINTAKSHQGQGIAGQLLLAQAGWFVEQAAYRVCVNVAQENDAARSLYTHRGAQPFGDFWMLWPDIRILIDGAEPAARLRTE